MDLTDPQTYRIAAGGPLRALERAARLARDDSHDLVRRVGIVLAIAYAPFLVALIASGDAAQHLALSELSTHVRALVAVPLLIVAESAFDVRAGEGGRYLQRSSIVAPERSEAHRAAVAETCRLRDSWRSEAALLLFSLGSVLAVPAFTREVAPALRWSMLPATLLYRFLFLRLLWRWGLWALYLGRISRLPLALRAAHPDRIAGLEPLAGPSVAFAIVVLAGAALLAAAWGDAMRFEGVRVTSHRFDALTYAVVALAAAIAPLLVFTPQLIRVRRRGTHAYGAMAEHFVDAFEDKWLHNRSKEVLGADEVQSLNDLGGAFERMQTMRVVVAPRVVIQAVIVAVVIPLVPLVLAELGAAELLARVAKVLF